MKHSPYLDIPQGLVEVHGEVELSLGLGLLSGADNDILIALHQLDSSGVLPLPLDRRANHEVVLVEMLQVHSITVLARVFVV